MKSSKASFNYSEIRHYGEIRLERPESGLENIGRSFQLVIRKALATDRRFDVDLVS